jgi:tetratricopeptide (TPR) repeat protein
VKSIFLSRNSGLLILIPIFIGCTPLTYNKSVSAGEPPPFDSVTSSFSQENPREVIYQLLVAELAWRRGEYDLALTSLLNLAKKFPSSDLAERATRIALHGRLYERAIQAAQLWLEQQPTNSKAREILIQLLMRRGDTKNALPLIEKVLEDTKESSLREDFINNWLKFLPNPVKIQETIEHLIAKRPDDPVLLLTQAELLISTEQEEEAKAVLTRLLEIKPDHEQAVALYAYILDKQNLTSQALEWLQKALDQYPEQHEWRLMYARLLADAEQYQASMTQFKQLQLQYPQNGEILYALGILALQLDQLSAARDYFLELIKTGEQVNTARFYLGQIAQAEKKYELALFWYQQIKGGSNYLNAVVRIALIYVEQGKIEKAVKYLRQVPVDNEEDASALLQLEAEILIEQQQYEQAMKAYNQALKLQPDDTDLLYMRSLLADKMGFVSQMEQDLRRILQLEPQNANALNALGYGLTEYTDRLGEAYELIKQALILKPNEHYILDSMGWILYKMGHYAESLAYLRKAQAKQADPEIAAHLGEVLWMSGERQSAQEIWEKALEQFPNDKKLREVIQRFLP